MSDEALIKINGLAKKYCSSLKQSLWYGVKDIAGEFNRHIKSKSVLRPGEFWALKDISVKLKRGECLGLIGANGSGKSTLLKLINGLIKPDQGKIEIFGRVGALIELGTGFNPILTGRENIYINGSVLGLKKSEIDAKLDSIIEFSEIAEYIDSPVQNYSSGMKVRLGFAIASKLEPDILLIDEVLAVGDVGFRSKCFNAIDKISKKAAVIFVSHQMAQVARICSNLIVLDKGSAIYQGNDIPTGIETYYSQFLGTESSISGSGKASIQNTKIYTEHESIDKEGLVKIDYLKNLYIELTFSLDPSIKDAVINIAFFDKEMRGAAQCYSSNCKFYIRNTGGLIQTRVKIPNLQLNPGIYDISFIIVDGRRGETLINYHAAEKFQVIGSFIGFAPVQFQGEWEHV